MCLFADPRQRPHTRVSVHELTAVFVVVVVTASCVYNSKLYRQSETWMDGCDKICVCVDQKTGRYECKER